MKIKSIILSGIASLAIASCSTPKDVTYFQGLNPGTIQASDISGAIKAVPDDKLSIIVNSKDPALAGLFNLPLQSLRLGAKSIATENSTGVSLYTVDEDGDIDFPVLGRVHVGGLTRSQIAAEIKHQLTTRDLVKDPTVTVEFANAGINVLGEVTHPGRYDMRRDRITILEGLAMAGDMTIQGMRENVMVLRENPDGSTTVFRLDLTDADNLYQSPAYYLQQNDVVYVEPNAHKKRERQANGNNVFTATFWMSVASLLTTIAVLIFK